MTVSHDFRCGRGVALAVSFAAFSALMGAVTVPVCAQPGVISTVVGDHKDAMNNPNLQAIFSTPAQVAVDGKGNLFVADERNNRIRRVEAGSGVITDVVGTGINGYSKDGVAATQARLWVPFGVALDSEGQLFFCDTGNNFIRRVDKNTGVLSTVAGTSKSTQGNGEGLLATFVELANPKGIALDADNNLFIADTFHNRICRVDRATNVFSIIAGNGGTGFTGDGGPAKEATLNRPHAIAVDAQGNIFVGDTLNSVVRRIDAKTGIISTVAGTGTAGSSGDGFLATQAQISGPYGLAVDSQGNLFIADLSGNRVRRIDAKTGLISTIAGTGQRGYSGDGGPAIKAQLSFPQGIALDTKGHLFIADSGNAVVRRVNNASLLALDGLIGRGGGGKRPPVFPFPFPKRPSDKGGQPGAFLTGTALPKSGCVYELEPFNLPGQRMTLSMGGADINGKLVLDSANGSPLQAWTFTSTGDGSWWISPANPATRLDSDQSGQGLKPNLAIRSANASDNQKWTISPLGEGSYSVQTPSAPDAPLTALVTTANGTFVTFQPNGGRPDQRWRLYLRQ